MKIHPRNRYIFCNCLIQYLLQPNILGKWRENTQSKLYPPLIIHTQQTIHITYPYSKYFEIIAIHLQSSSRQNSSISREANCVACQVRKAKEEEHHVQRAGGFFKHAITETSARAQPPDARVTDPHHPIASALLPVCAGPARLWTREWFFFFFMHIFLQSRRRYYVCRLYEVRWWYCERVIGRFS